MINYDSISRNLDLNRLKIFRTSAVEWSRERRERKERNERIREEQKENAPNKCYICKEPYYDNEIKILRNYKVSNEVLIDYVIILPCGHLMTQFNNWRSKTQNFIKKYYKSFEELNLDIILKGTSKRIQVTCPTCGSVDIVKLKDLTKHKYKYMDMLPLRCGHPYSY